MEVLPTDEDEEIARDRWLAGFFDGFLSTVTPETAVAEPQSNDEYAAGTSFGAASAAPYASDASRLASATPTRPHPEFAVNDDSSSAGSPSAAAPVVQSRMRRAGRATLRAAAAVFVIVGVWTAVSSLESGLKRWFPANGAAAKVDANAETDALIGVLLGSGPEAERLAAAKILRERAEAGRMEAARKQELSDALARESSPEVAIEAAEIVRLLG